MARPGHDAAQPIGWIETTGGIIAAIGAEPEPAGRAGDLLALPAFANAHDHGRGAQSLSLGISDGPLELWLSRLGAEPHLDPYLRAAPAFARMAESGIAAVMHCHNTQDGRALMTEAQGVARAAGDVGIRVAFAVPFAGENPIVYGDTDRLSGLFPTGRPPSSGYRRSLKEGLCLVDAIAEMETPLFSVQYGPVGPQWTGREALETIACRSAQDGRRVHMHFFETYLQREWADAHFPDGIVTYFDRIDLLSPRLTLAHGVWLREGELDLLAERGVILSCNMSSNFRLSSGLPPIRKVLEHGVRFGIGLDGMSLEDDDDILREMRLLRGVAQALDPGPCGAGDRHGMNGRWFDALLKTGREAILGPDGGGALVPGAPADFAIVDTKRVRRHVVGTASLPDLLITRLSRRDISTLVVAGEAVVENGACTRVSREELEQALYEDILRHANDRSQDAHADKMEQAIRHFYGCGCHRQP
ncbi:amidohydrolase family protein [Acidomonas methanolica]|uniref:amidohydrolase family protein n=1 Tax=Acidomonas methanolica TaxID=437 RepID=UPI00211A35AF|nr:amidohydrolase family protein [Acidomonas methanolica]MCQ9154942.1 amidohydrolase family protein [Acidomonas methanolica]